MPKSADSVLNFKASSPATPIVVLSGLEDLDAELGSLGISSENFLPKSSLSCSLLEEKIHTALKKHQYKLEAVAQSLEQDPESTQPSPEELRKFAAALRSGPLRALALPDSPLAVGDETVAYKLLLLSQRRSPGPEGHPNLQGVAAAWGTLHELRPARPGIQPPLPRLQAAP